MCKYENHKAAIINFFGNPLLVVMDPSMAQDIWQTKNKIVDKTGAWQQMFEDLIPSSLLFQKGDDDWAQKRKACAHAFAKDKLSKMLDVLRGQLMERINRWAA